MASFKELSWLVGCQNRRNIAASQNLLKLLAKNGDIPRINLVVDIYNLISVKTRLSLGAHDVDRVEGNIHLRLTDGTETYWPLGSEEPKSVKSGEYSYVDDSNEVICRLEVRQCLKTKVTTQTNDCFYIVQGNRETSKEYISRAAAELIELTTRFCGGDVEILHTP